MIITICICTYQVLCAALRIFSFRFSAQGDISKPAELLTEHSKRLLCALGARPEHTTIDGGEPGAQIKRSWILTSLLL